MFFSGKLRYVRLVGAVAILTSTATAAPKAEDRICIYKGNPHYWQYKGKPVLLVGGSKDDNLFQLPEVEKHLQEMKAVGGNFVRNTMSDRNDKGFEVYPFKKLDNGKYDLNQWNEEYWKRFDNFMRKTHQLDIFVQIEVWDRFDYSQRNWEPHPYRPNNNINYTTPSSGLADRYPDPAWYDTQPFFHSIPGMPRYVKQLDTVRKYQEKFVAKMLSYSLKYGHVLYCMNNETSTPPAWGRYWIAFIEKEAKKRGVSVYCTDMFNDGYKPETSGLLAQAYDDVRVYKFLDISQINSRLFNEDQWAKLMWVVKRIKKHPRPLNCVKIYGSGQTKWGSGTPVDGVERLWRNLFAGCAAVRSHRDGAGIGLQPISKACIKAVRKVETLVKFWDVESHQELLSDRGKDEAYLIARPGDAYVLYFTSGGSVGLNMKRYDKDFRLKWIDISTGEWGKETHIRGGKIVQIKTPGKGPYAAVIMTSVSTGTDNYKKKRLLTILKAVVSDIGNLAVIVRIIPGTIIMA
ncbi:MAG: hypothetical protein JSV03_11985 [Planctomycetota bacterium]|nr:MAG: hypothetical protein JSV03_11985 [Planctomycetota bacterium]